MRLRSLRKENSKLKEMIETLEQIKDKFTEIHNMCRCDCVKNNPDEMNKLEFLMLKYEQLKNQEEEENIYQDEDESNEIVPLKNNTNSDSTDDGLKKKTKLRIVRKKGSRYSPLKKGRVGRPRKEEWPLFEQEKLLKATYVCTWEGCDKRYYYNAHLINHIRMHKGERPFVCEWPGCGKRYLTNSILVSHVRSAHKKDDKPDSDGDSRVKRLPYSCEFCGVNFRRRDQLDSHSSAVHSSAKPLQCDWPGCDFQTVINSCFYLF